MHISSTRITPKGPKDPPNRQSQDIRLDVPPKPSIKDPLTSVRVQAVLVSHPERERRSRASSVDDGTKSRNNSSDTSSMGVTTADDFLIIDPPKPALLKSS